MSKIWPTIVSLDELKIQLALGSITLNSRIPKGLDLNATTRRLRTNSKMHRMLSRGVELGGILPRTEITKVVSTNYSTIFIIHAEVMGLMKRLHPYTAKRGKHKVVYEITDIGRKAVNIR